MKKITYLFILIASIFGFASAKNVTASANSQYSLLYYAGNWNSATEYLFDKLVPTGQYLVSYESNIYIQTCQSVVGITPDKSNCWSSTWPANTNALSNRLNTDEINITSNTTAISSINAQLTVIDARLLALESKTPTPTPSPTPTPAVESILFSPYKDVGINAFWGNTNKGTMGTTVLDNTTPTPSLLLSTVPSDVNTVTWAFASGSCTAESWGSFSRANVLLNKPLFVSANKNYIISTGGLAGAFTCDTDANLVSFVDAYYSTNMVGLDFDIENTLTTTQIASLTSGIKAVQAKYPSLRISYTVATLAGSDGSGLIVGSSGEQAILSAQTAGIKFNVNLMVMDYGTASSVCVIDSGTGYCDMNLSAQQATKNLNAKYSIAYNNIELTPMIGLNDVDTNNTSLANVSDLATWVKSSGLAGMHIWSYDRDASCNTNWAVNAVPTVCSGAIESVPFQTTSLQYQETIVSKLK